VVACNAIEGIHHVFGAVYLPGAIRCWAEHLRWTVSILPSMFGQFGLARYFFREVQTIGVVEYDTIEGIHPVFGAVYVPGAIWCSVEHQIDHINPAINVQPNWVEWKGFEEVQTIGAVIYDAIEGIQDHTSQCILGELLP
jgi:hypothetical protein